MLISRIMPIMSLVVLSLVVFACVPPASAQALFGMSPSDREMFLSP